jgi:hypothetical protein
VAGAALIPSSLYGLRTWRVVAGEGGERLAGPQSGEAWPAGGAWLEARCTRPGGHAAPAPDCACGIHAWHPGRESARAVLARRREIAGVVEARGAIEVHADGFRAERARPCALVTTPRSHRALVARLARAYDAQVIEVTGAAALARWCEERGLGLGDAAVGSLLGQDGPVDRRRMRRAAARRAVLRVVAAVALAAALVGAGLALTSTPPHGKVLYGRAGRVVVP